MNSRSTVVEKLLSVAVFDLLQRGLSVSSGTRSCDAEGGGCNGVAGGAWRTRRSASADRWVHSDFAWKISPRSRTTGFAASDPSEGDMLSRGNGRHFIQRVGRPSA